MTIKLRQNILGKGMASLYLDIHDNGRQPKKFLGIKIYIKPKTHAEKLHNEDKLKLARMIVAKYELDQQYLKHGIDSPIAKNFDFFQYFDDYNQNYNKGDKKNHTASLKHLKVFAWDRYKLKQLKNKNINAVFCEDFSEYLKEHFNGNTPVGYWKNFKKVLKRAYRQGLVSLNPDMIETRLPVDNEIRKEILELPELIHLWKTACANKEIKRAFLYCCLCTGYGWKDVKNLKYKNIGTSGTIVKDREKTNVRATSFFTELGAMLITERGEPEEPVFNLSMTANGANKVLRIWLAKSGIKKHITWYSARHTFGVLLNDSGLDLRNLAAALGHSEKSGYKHVIKYTRVKNRAIEQKMNEISASVISKLKETQ